MADEINGQIQQHIIDKLHQKQVDLSASNPRFNQALDLLSGEKERYEQQPRAFFYPECLDDEAQLPEANWVRLWKLHGSINWELS